MKKLLTLLCTASLLCACNNTNNHKEVQELKNEVEQLKQELKQQKQAPAAPQPAAQPQQRPAAKAECAPEPSQEAQNFSMHWNGRIGGYDAFMYVTNGEGEVTLEGNGKRTLRVRSYDGKKLIIDAYLNKKYIGYYKGKVSEEGLHYKGEFKNTVTGGEVDFDLRCYGE